MNHLSVILFFVASFAGAWFLSPRTRPSPATENLVIESSKRIPTNSQHQKLSKIRRFDSPENRLRQIIALASSIPINEIKDWQHASALDSFDSELKSLFRSITCDRWFEASPREFLLWENHSGHGNLAHYLTRWATQDLEATTAFISDTPLSFTKEHLFNTLVGNLLKDHPSLAFVLAREQIGRSIDDRSSIEQIFRLLAEHDLDKMISFCETFPSEITDSTHPIIVGNLLKTDFAQAIAYLRKNEHRPEILLESKYTTGKEKFADLLIANHRQLPEGWLEKILAGNTVVLRSPKSLDWLESDPAQLGLSEETFSEFFQIHSSIDFGPENRPRVMALLNREDLPLKNRKRLLLEQARKWPSQDPGGLANWLGELASPDLVPIAENALTNHQRKAAPVRTSKPTSPPPALLSVLKSSHFRNSTSWSSDKTQSTISAFQNLAPEDQRNTYLNLKSIIRHSNTNRPFTAEVIATIANQPPPEKIYAQNQEIHATSIFATRWAVDDPAEAAAWVTQLPPGPHRLWAVKNVARTWKNYSPQEAQAWLENLPQTEQVEIQSFLENQP